MELSAEIAKEVKERFMDEVNFVFVPFKEKFVCKIKDPLDPGYTYDLFIVEDDFKRPRPVTMEDIYRVERAKVFDKDAKIKAKKELDAKLAAETRAKIDKKPSKRSEIITDIGKDLSRNPAMSRAFVSDAKRKYGVKTENLGNRTIMTPEKK